MWTNEKLIKILQDDFFDGFPGVRIQVGKYIISFEVKFQFYVKHIFRRLSESRDIKLTYHMCAVSHKIKLQNF